MRVNLDPDFFKHLTDLLEILEEVRYQHSGLSEHEEIVEPWTPSPENPYDEPEQISIPQFTVGSLKCVETLLKNLKEGKAFSTESGIIMTAKGLLDD